MGADFLSLGARFVVILENVAFLSNFPTEARFKHNSGNPTKSQNVFV